MTGTVDGVTAITFDFGNTLAPVGHAALRQVVERTADSVCERWPDLDRGDFLATWDEERERQFREEVPQFREVDLAQRLIRILARLRGAMAAPAPDQHWDDTKAATLTDPADIAWAVDAYSAAFVDGLPPEPGATDLLARLAATHDLAILSNWPLAATIDRYADAHGWTPHLRAIVVSQRVGTIKPHPAIFAAARAALGDPAPQAILHVGDDWAADVVGAATAGWRTAWLSNRPSDSPLPASERDDSVQPDLVLGSLAELEAALAAFAAPGGAP